MLYVAVASVTPRSTSRRTGEPAQLSLTAPVLMRRMEKIREALGGAAVLEKVRALHG